jgi:hypothetical protein
VGLGQNLEKYLIVIIVNITHSVQGFLKPVRETATHDDRDSGWPRITHEELRTQLGSQRANYLALLKLLN